MLTTNTELAPAAVALKYKQLWMVEDVFRSMKSLLDTRPIYHKCDETIRGNVFCSFLALLLSKELQDRLDRKGSRLELGRRDPGSGQPRGDGNRHRRQRAHLSQPGQGIGEPSLSGLRRRAAADIAGLS